MKSSQQPGSVRMWRWSVALSLVAVPAVGVPLTVTEVETLEASDGAMFGGYFGSAVDVDGDVAVVGAYANDEVATNSGAAYIFQRHEGGADLWHEVARLTEATGSDNFGSAVAVDGDTVVIGALLADDNALVNSGSVYVYSRNEGGTDAWGLVATLSASDAHGSAQFGSSVDIDGDTLVVGANSQDGAVESDTGAAYVFVRDQGGSRAWGEVAKLTAGDAAAGDFFGDVVAIDGDTVIVGAKSDDDAGDGSGSAYVFSRHAGGPNAWGEVTKLVAADGEAFDNFGASVALSGDTAVIGMPFDDDQAADSGAAYVFFRLGSSWSQAAKLIAADGGDSWFGEAVAIDGDTVVVGASFDDGDGLLRGSTYLFSRNQDGSNGWQQTAKILAGDAADQDRFGSEVAVNGNTVLVGIEGRSSFIGAAKVYSLDGEVLAESAKMIASDGAADDELGSSIAVYGDTGIVGAPQDDGLGAAYIFQRNNGGADSWGEVTKLTASDATLGDEFGSAVAINGDTAVVGARENDGTGSSYVFSRNKTGANAWGEVVKIQAGDGVIGDDFGASVAIDGDTLVVGAPQTGAGGAVYVYYRDEGGANAWGEVVKLTSSDLAVADDFGGSVAIDGDLIVVGADEDDDAGSLSGSAYIFSRHEGGDNSWGEVAKITASDGASGDIFGNAVSVSGDTVLVAARSDDDLGSGSGSAYLFSRNHNGVGSWGQVTKLTASDGLAFELFGWSVSVDGDTAVVGSYWSEVDAETRGAAYVFSRAQDGTANWLEVAKLSASDGAASDNLGIAVDVDGDTVVAGAWRGDGQAADSGSAYAYNLDFPLDFGDAPAPAYPTLRAHDGARHAVSGLFLGSEIDAETEGQPNANADGDDSDTATNDEDGVVFGILAPGETGEAEITVAGAGGAVSAWIDFNADGDWDEANELILDNVQLATGTHLQDFSVPSGAAIGNTYARFRLASAGGDTPTGFAVDGEVEDYRVTITPNNGCGGVDVVFADTTVLSGEVVQCTASNSMTVESTVTVESGGRIELFSPQVGFQDGFSLPQGAEMQVSAGGAALAAN